MVTYRELNDFLLSKAEEHDPAEREPWCNITLRYTLEFAEMHDLDFDHLVRILLETGSAYCDCKVVSYAMPDIPPDEVIGKETFSTPVQIAIKKGYYIHCRWDGQPISFPMAVALKAKGLKVDFHVPCNKDDPYAFPDAERVIEEQDGWVP